MFPTLVEGPTPTLGLHTYGMFILLAFCSAFVLVHWRSAQVGFNTDKLGWLYLASAVGGISGGKLLYHTAVDPFWVNPSSLANFSGFALYGGVLGGAIAVAAVAIPLKFSLWKLADIAAPAVAVGIGVGRMGCFFAGCCHGAVAPVSDNPTALLPDGLLHGQIWLSSMFPYITTEFHDGVGRLLHEPLYPTQLWSIVAGLGVCLFAQLIWRFRVFDGMIAAVVLLVEPVFRIFIEAFRADHRGYVVQWPVSEEVVAMFPGMSKAGDTLGEAVMGITTSQAIGLGMMLLGLCIVVVRVVWIYVLKKSPPMGEEIPFVSEETDDLDDDLDE